MSEAEDLMRAWRFGKFVGEKALHRGSANSKASKEAKVGAGRSRSGTKKPKVYLRVKRNYSFRVRMASLIETLVSEMVKRREAEERMAAALERLMKWVEETEKLGFGEGEQ